MKAYRHCNIVDEAPRERLSILSKLPYMQVGLQMEIFCRIANQGEWKTVGTFPNYDSIFSIDGSKMVSDFGEVVS